jgi:hypothetical protein
VPTIVTIGNETTWGFVDPWGEYNDRQDTDGWSWTPEGKNKKFLTILTGTSLMQHLMLLIILMPPIPHP